jgi:hypothetical protein
MHTGVGQIAEIYLDGSAQIDCPSNIVPLPGQYLLAHAHGSDSPLAVPVFQYDSGPNGFRAAPPVPSTWSPGTHLSLRGPLGHGFSISLSLNKLAIIAFDDSPARMHGLISPALKDNREVVLVCDSISPNLPEAVEVSPLKSIPDVCKWADFIALDVARENLGQLKEMILGLDQIPAVREAQVLIRTPMPCGGLADCGVCAVTIYHDWKMSCKDGPVFILKDIIN